MEKIVLLLDNIIPYYYEGQMSHVSFDQLKCLFFFRKNFQIFFFRIKFFRARKLSITLNLFLFVYLKPVD
jgi:hypothetical protein